MIESHPARQNLLRSLVGVLDPHHPFIRLFASLELPDMHRVNCDLRHFAINVGQLNAFIRRKPAVGLDGPAFRLYLHNLVWLVVNVGEAFVIFLF